MTDFTISAAAIEQATNGAVHQKMMVNWNDRELWLTPVQPAMRGKPRFYSYANALEAALAAALVESGLTRERVNLIIKRRCVAASGQASGWTGEHAKVLETLPEWSWPSAWWIVIDNRATSATLAVKSMADLDPEIFDTAVVRVVNLRVIKNALDASLAQGEA